jgi:hypothetical protein
MVQKMTFRLQDGVPAGLLSWLFITFL